MCTVQLNHEKDNYRYVKCEDRLVAFNDYVLNRKPIIENQQLNCCRVKLKFKNLHHTGGILRKRATTSGVRFRGLAPEQHIFEVTSQWRRAFGDTASDLTSPEIKLKTSCSDRDVFITTPKSGQTKIQIIG